MRRNVRSNIKLSFENFCTILCIQESRTFGIFQLEHRDRHEFFIIF